MSAPLAFLQVLTEHRELDIMHRRAGRDARPLKDGPYGKHADAHKYCTLGRCGTRAGPYSLVPASPVQYGRPAKITAWRKAKAQANRAFLEERVYGHTK